MDTIRLPRLGILAAPSAVAAGYGVLALASLYLTQGANGIATIWPASGWLVACLLLTPKRHRLACLAAAALASLAANLAVGTPTSLAAAFTLANIVEACVAVAVLEARRSRNTSFLRLSDLGLFCLGAIVAGGTSTVIATALSGGDIYFLTSWFTTVVMGILIITPTVIMAHALIFAVRVDWMVERPRQEIVALLLMVGVVAAGVFGQTRYPLLFLPVIAVLVATYRLGVAGAAASVLITATIGSVLTARGTGPVQFVNGGPGAVVLFLQFYLLILMASALPAAALLTGQRTLAGRLRSSNRLLRQAEAAAQLGHWSADLIEGTLFWSEEVYRIHGLPNDAAPDLEQAVTVYHPEDQRRVRRALGRAMVDGAAFGFDARVVRPNGEVCHVQARGQSVLNDDGDAVALFGVIQDVTQHVRLAQELEEARQMAVASAQRERELANTDELTGLPNRRRTLEVLETAIAHAKSAGTPLSVAILDVDHFKAVNDRCGHAVGDEVLRCVAVTARRALRGGDFVGRYGGEEFVVILPDAASGTAMRVAERVRALIERESCLGDRSRAVTVSLGIAALRDDLGGEALLQLADKALYRAKAAGRNSLFLAA